MVLKMNKLVLLDIINLYVYKVSLYRGKCFLNIWSTQKLCSLQSTTMSFKQKLTDTLMHVQIKAAMSAFEFVCLVPVTRTNYPTYST